MSDLLTAIGLILVIEGAVYALFPEGMKRLMAVVLGQPASTLRVTGLVAATVGLVVVWLVRA